MQKCIFYRGLYEPELTAIIGAELRPGDTFADVGANAGYFSFLAASRVGRSGRVIAFEPSADLSGRIGRAATAFSGRRRRGRGVATIEVHDVALSDRDGYGTLSPAIDHRSGERFITDNAEGDPVRLVTLGGYLPDVQPDIVKIDVEGAELRVLYGMEAILRAGTPRLVVVEAIEGNAGRFGDSVAAIADFMDRAGYAGSIVQSEYSAPMIAFWRRPSSSFR